MRIPFGVIAISFILVICVVVNAQTASADDSQPLAKLDAYIKAEMGNYKIPGVSVAVLRDGKVSMLQSYGLANVELNVPVKPETIFQSGSIGKQFTAAAVMLLVQDGKLSLEDKITKYLVNTPQSWKEITVRNLLTHTSGLGDYPEEISLRGDYTEDDYIRIFQKTPLNFAPGSKWDYSNVGYVTLGIIIRRITGKFYGDFLRERLFGPLGMSTTRVISEADIIPNRASGYRLLMGELKNQEWVSPSTNSTADGSLYLSILDLMKWDEALRKAESGSETLFTRATLQQIWTPVKLSEGRVKTYGFGWFTDSIHGRRLVFHGGAWQGFKSFIIRFLDEKLTIIFLANSWNTNDFKLARGLIAHFYPEFALDQVTKSSVAAEPRVTDLLRRVLMQLANNKLDQSLFTRELGVDDVRKFGATLNSLSLPVAVVHLGELVKRRSEGNLRVYEYVLTDIGQTLICKLKLTQDDKIAGIELLN